LVDVQIGLQKEAQQLKIFADDYEVTVNDRHMQPNAAVICLMRDHGLHEKTAREAIKQAKAQRGARFWIKRAEPYELQRSAPSAPVIPDAQMGSDDFFMTGLPANHPLNYEMPVTGMTYQRPGFQNYASPPESSSAMSVMQGAQAGQKELLDSSLLQSLLKGTQDETVVDRFLGPLVKGLDALGRLYFNFLWHHDLFENRYGSDKLPDMEDSLRNNFDNMGDLILAIKKPGTQSLPGEQLEDSMEAMAET